MASVLVLRGLSQSLQSMNHPNALLLEKLHGNLGTPNYQHMAACYREDASFEDIAFHLRGRLAIQAMWHMISTSDLKATFSIAEVDDSRGVANLVDEYTFMHRGTKKHPVRNVIRSEFTFKDGLIQTHHDHCNPFSWGIQALGPFEGVVAGLIPAVRQDAAAKKLRAFINGKPEYASLNI